jgi:hypothetical protein
MTAARSAGGLSTYPIFKSYAIGAMHGEANLSIATLDVTGSAQRHVLDLTRLIDL